ALSPDTGRERDTEVRGGCANSSAGGQMEREAEAAERLRGVEERVHRLDAVIAELEHLERPWCVPALGVDPVLGESRTAVGLPGEQPRSPALAARADVPREHVVA